MSSDARLGDADGGAESSRRPIMAGIEQTNGSGAPRGKRITGRSRNPTGPLGLRLRTGSGRGGDRRERRGQRWAGGPPY